MGKKGDNKFTPEVAEQIKSLLRERSNVSPNKQKRIRAKIRSYGFYISDYWWGFTDVDFENEVNEGRILIGSGIKLHPDRKI